MLPSTVLCTRCNLYTVSAAGGSSEKGGDGTVLLSEFSVKPVKRYSVPLFNTVLSGAGPDGYGVAYKSVTMIGAPPGTGKSTACLQSLSDLLAQHLDRIALYLFAEQDLEDFAAVAHRLQLPHMDRLRVIPAMGNIEMLLGLDDWLKKYKPVALVFDSLQSVAGNDQEAALGMIKVLKERSSQYAYPTFVISQVTKDGDLAGSEKIQHEVDALVHLESLGIERGSPRENPIKIVCMDVSTKNRNGPAPKKAFFRLTEVGLVEIHHAAQAGLHELAEVHVGAEH